MTNSIDCDRANQYLGSIREMIRHEDQLLNQRLTWMWILQGLLFNSAGFLWTSKDVPVIIIAFVGLSSCITIGYSIKRGMLAIVELLKIAKEYKESIEIDCRVPPTIGSRSKAIEWLLPGNSLPWIMGLAWCALIIFRILQ